MSTRSVASGNVVDLYDDSVENFQFSGGANFSVVKKRLVLHRIRSASLRIKPYVHVKILTDGIDHHPISRPDRSTCRQSGRKVRRIAYEAASHEIPKRVDQALRGAMILTDPEAFRLDE
jgi:hypothetical protein